MGPASKKSNLSPAAGFTNNGALVFGKNLGTKAWPMTITEKKTTNILFIANKNEEVTLEMCVRGAIYRVIAHDYHNKNKKTCRMSSHRVRGFL